MIKRTADLVNDKKIEGIANIRDESEMVCVLFIF
jgi:DNA gyrase/topoisomerase IV subunit A